MPMPLPPLNALRAFEAAARNGSYVAAASEIGVSPAAISQHIRKLEEFYGKVLFLRLTNGVRLTDAGQAIFDGTSGALRAISDQSLEILSDRVRQRLVFSCIGSVAECWALPRLIEYSRQLPGFRFDLRVDADPIDFGRHDVDLRLCYGMGHYPDFNYIPLCHDQVEPMCSPAWLSARPDVQANGLGALQPCDLLHTSWGPSFGSNPSWRSWFSAAGLPARSDDAGHRISQSGLALDMARAGLGVALGQRMLAQTDLERGSLLALSQISLPLGHGYGLVTPRLKSKRRAIVALTQWLLQSAAPAGISLPAQI